jgi:hypothetical protein
VNRPFSLPLLGLAQLTSILLVTPFRELRESDIGFLLNLENPYQLIRFCGSIITTGKGEEQDFKHLVKQSQVNLVREALCKR